MTALDFSYARPGSTALNSVGVTSVGRYLGTDGRCIALTELQDYLNHGVSVWFIKENAANGMLGGSVQGIRDATAAQQQLDALGQYNAAVYFTADFNAQPYQFAALDAYLTGVATVIPVSRIGIYAGNDYLNHSAALVTYRWKTASSSFDHGQTATVPVHLIQTTDPTPIANTDNDQILIAEHGQVGALGTATAGPSTPIPSDAVKAIQTALNAHGYTLTVDGISGPLTDAAIRDYQGKHGLAVDGIVGPLTWASLNGTPTPTSYPAFPLPAGSYFGPATGPANSVSGYYSHNADLRVWQAQMSGRGWTITPDGLYGPQTASVTRAFQTQKNLTVDALIGPQTWAAAWTAPLT